jgi:hypothetical protein
VFLYEAIYEVLEVGPTVIPAAKFSSWLNEVHKEKDNIILKHFKVCVRNYISYVNFKRLFISEII